MGRPKGSTNRSKAGGTATKDRAPKPLPPLSGPINAHAAQVLVGMPIPHIQRVRQFSPAEWEDFIHEWAHCLKSKYHEVERCGGAGDQGRDVIAYATDQLNGSWDNYQCKRYDHPLAPGDVWLELGKLCHYTYKNEFTKPRHYYFVAPHDVGTTLSKLIDKPTELRKRLMEVWADKCENEITETEAIKLEGAFRDYVAGFDFSIIRKISTLTVIEQHKSSPFHVLRFGGGLPNLPAAKAPPTAIATGEARYVEQLMEAYGEHVGQAIASVEALAANAKLSSHFNRSREHFYLAETLRNFSRDHLPPGEYERLKDEIHDGVFEVVSKDYKDGYERIIETTQEARRLQVTGHPLIHLMQGNHRTGICHQLANDDRLTWVKPK